MMIRNIASYWMRTVVCLFVLNSGLANAESDATPSRIQWRTGVFDGWKKAVPQAPVHTPPPAPVIEKTVPSHPKPVDPAPPAATEAERDDPQESEATTAEIERAKPERRARRPGEETIISRRAQRKREERRAAKIEKVKKPPPHPPKQTNPVETVAEEPPAPEQLITNGTPAQPVLPRQVEQPVDIGTMREALNKWVETQQLISKEKRDWQLGKDILRSRIDLVKTEIAALEEKLKLSSGNTKDIDQRKVELVAQNEALKAAAAFLQRELLRREAETRQLFNVLPDSVQAKLAPLYQRMPTDASNMKASLAERFQNVLGILNEVNKVNGEVTVASEVRTLSNGKPSEVKTVYVGLAQAYYVSPKGEAGVGHPSEAGWQWQPANELAGGVAEVVEILQNKGRPKFVPLPVRIQ